MKFKLRLELVNQDMEILKCLEMEIEDKSYISAEIKARKKAIKKYPTEDASVIWVVSRQNKRDKKYLPLERVINYIKSQIEVTRQDYNNLNDKDKQYAEHRRAAYKLCLLAANRELKEESAIIDAFHTQREKDWISFSPKPLKKKK